MIRGAIEEASEIDPDALRETYQELLAEAISAVGVEEARTRTALSADDVNAIAAGDDSEVNLEDAATILGLDPDRPAAESIRAEARDILLMGMSQAVLDVEALSAGIDGAIAPKELQQKIEGRHQMTLDEYATVHAFIENRKG